MSISRTNMRTRALSVFLAAVLTLLLVLPYGIKVSGITGASQPWPVVKAYMESVVPASSPQDCAQWVYQALRNGYQMSPSYTGGTDNLMMELDAAGFFVGTIGPSTGQLGTQVSDAYNAGTVKPGDILICYTASSPSPTIHTLIVGDQDVNGPAGYRIAAYQASLGSYGPAKKQLYYALNEDSGGSGSKVYDTVRVYRVIQDKGSIKVVKGSSNPTVTNGNSYYQNFSNATFVLYPSNADAVNKTNPITSLNTNASGIATLENVTPGTYYMRETTPPANYQATDYIWTVTVNAGQETVVGVNDAPSLGSIALTKTTSDLRVINNSNYSLGDAEYGVYRTASDANLNINKVTTIKTNEDGTKTTGLTLPYGTYYVKETAAPLGYIADTTTYTVVVDGANIALDVEDDPILGGIELRKTSANSSVSDDNNMYSLAGAEYSIYESENDAKANTNSVGTLVTDSNGIARFGELPMMTYYVAETKAAFNYDHDIDEDGKPNVYQVIVDANGTATDRFNVRNVTDEPINDPIFAWVWKIDSEGNKHDGKSAAQMGASLEDAEFTIRYYDGYFMSAEAAIASGIPKRTWVIVTDEDGFATLSEDYLSPVSDALYYDPDGYPTIPIGTVLTQETKAPEGYLLPDPAPINKQEVFPDGTGLSEVDAFNEYEAEDLVKRGDFYVMKMFVDEGNVTNLGIPEEGIIFDIYAPAQYEGSTPKDGAAPMLSLATDADGVISTEELYVIENADGSFTQRAREASDSGALPYGTYLFVQRNTIGYRDKVAPFTIFVSEDGKTSLKTVNNVLYHSAIKILKEDSETDEKVPVSATWQIINRDTGDPVEMVVYYPQETHITEFISNENGELMLPEKLASGKYGLEEVTAPAKNGIGYIRNTTNVEFDIPVGPGKGFDDPIIVTMKDVPGKGQITVTKSDGGSKKGYVSGAVYTVKAAQDIYTLDGTLRASKGDTVDTITTGTDGKAKTKQLYLGRYTVQEKTNPAGYVMDTQAHEVGLAYEGQDVPVVQASEPLTDDSVKVGLTKLDSSTNEPIQGAGFRITGTKAAGGTYTDTQTSGKDGHVLFEYIPPGEYKLSEYAKVPGYFTNEATYEFTVTEDGIVTGLPGEGIVFYNDPTVLELDKVDGFTGEPLSGAEFTITGKDERTVNEAGIRSSLTGLGVGSAAINTLIADMAAQGSTFGSRTFDVGGTKVTATLGDGSSVNITTTTGGDTAIPGLGDAPFTLVANTDENGHIIFKYIPEGTFTLTETDNPDTYLLEDVSYDFEVTAKGAIEGLTDGLLIENEPTTIELHKKDGRTTESLFGVEFTVTGTTFGGDPYEAKAYSDGGGHVVFRYLPAGDYKMVETNSPEGYFNDGKEYNFRVNGKGEVIGFPEGLIVYNYPSIIEFTKVDGLTGRPLQGATFEVSGTKLTGEPYSVSVTSAPGGQVRFMYMPAGSYTFRETNNPDGYIFPDISYDFEIDIRGKITGDLPEDKVLKNYPTSVELDKIDAVTGEPLEYARFMISGTTKDGEPYETLIYTDADGHVAFNYVPEGSYTLSETESPDGYVLPDFSLGLIVDPEGNVVGLPENIVVENGPTVIEFDKTDSFTGEPLEDAEFTLSGKKRSGENYTIKSYSDDKGKVTFEYVPEGWFTVKETANPDGYLLEGVSYSIVVSAEGTVSGLPEDLTIENSPTTIEFDKTDSLTGAPLKDAEFLLKGTKKGGGNYEAKAKSDANGHVLFRYVPEGSYKLTEVSNPDTYVLPDVSYDISVNANGELSGLPKGLVIENSPTTIEFDKTDSLTGAPLKDAEFLLKGTKKGGGNYEVKAKSDANGHVRFEYVPAGKFTITETANPDGYVLGDVSYDFEVSTDGEVTGLPDDLVVTNIPTSIELEKVDGLTGDALRGAEFTLSGNKKSGEPFEKKAFSDEDGKVIFSYIPEGQFIVTETANPDTYLLGEVSYKFTVNALGKAVGLPKDLTVENDPTVVEFDKIDGFTKAPLEGAEFKITGETRLGEPYEDTAASDNKGHVLFDYIPAGKYVLAEAEAPDGYILPEGEYRFAVNVNGEVLGLPKNLVIENNPTVVELDKTDGSTGKVLAGATFEINGETAGGKPYKQEGESDSKGHIKFDYIPAGKYVITETANPDGYTLGEVSYKFTVNKKGVALGLPRNLTVKNNPTLIELDKIDTKTGRALEGAQFTLEGETKAGGDYSKNVLSDAKGHVKFDYVPAGKYTLTETANPDGYVLDSVSYKIGVNVRGEVTGLPDNLLVNNAPVAAELDKVDALTGKALPGAEFTVTGTTAKGDPYSQVTVSDSEGHVKFEYIPEGSFILTETKSPDGYVLDNIPYGFTANKNGEIEGLPDGIVAENPPTTVELAKVAEPDGSPLPGAVFKLYGNKANGEHYENTSVSNEKGRVIFEYVPEGNFAIAETKSPRGYILSDSSYGLSVDANGIVTGLPENLTVANAPTALELDKIDGLTGKPLIGAEFTISGTDTEGQPYEDSSFSDEDGRVVFNYIPAGSFNLTETGIPDMYVQSDVIYTFTVDEKGDITGLPEEGIVVENIPTKVELDKTDGLAAQPLAGAKFALTGTTREGEPYEEIKTSDEAGHLLFEYIPAGNFKLTETLAPDGYILPDAAWEFEIDGRGQITGLPNYITVENFPVIVELDKVDGLSDAPLEGVEFSIMSEDEKFIDTAISDDEGHVIFEYVPYGNHILTETKAKEGYYHAEVNYEFAVTEKGIVEGLPDEGLVIKNIPVVIEADKVDSLTGLPLEGVEFTIQGEKASGEPYETKALTNAAGHVKFMYVPEGSFTLAETKSLEGYFKTNASYEFTVNCRDGAVGLEDNIVVENTPTVLQVSKIDEFTSLPIEGVEFIITGQTVSGDLYETVGVTDMDGHIVFRGTPEGIYTLTETKIPEGYIDEKINIGFTVDADGEVLWPEDAVPGAEPASIIISNTPITVEISKLDFTDKTFVAGAVLEVYRENGTDPLDWWQTAEDSHLIYYLPVGEYILREKEVPLGYEKAEDIFFTVSDELAVDTETEESEWVQGVVMYDERVIPAISPKTADTFARIFFVILPLALLGVGIGIIGLRRLRKSEKQID
jgi:uncharacterized surface anchored protein